MSCQKKPLNLRDALLSVESNQVPVTTSVTAVILASLALPVYAAEHSNTTETSVTQLEGVTATATKAVPASNPNADPQAPYKVDKSGSGKITEPLVNVPKTINVVGKEQMKDAGVSALKDLMRTQPGITLGTGEGGNAQGDRFIIRGFDSRNDMFVDGLRDPGVTTRETFSTEQVEITKGANSTIGGRGTTGGTVNSITKKPQSTNFVRGTVTFGDEKRTTLDANRVINDKLKVRTNLMLQDSDVAGRDHVYDKRKGLAVAADYQATDNVGLLLDYYHLEGENMPDYGHPWDPVTNKPVDVKRDNFYGVLGRDFQETSADILSGTVDVKLSENTKLTSKTRVGETTNDYVAGAPERANMTTGTVNSGAKSGGYTNKITANNTQITHERHIGNTEHTFVAGVDISDEKITNQPFLSTLGSATLNIQNPQNDQGAVTVTRRDGKSQLDAETRSIYLMDTAKLNEKWQVNGGLRYDDFKINSSTFNYTTNALNTPIPYSKAFTNGQVGVVYKPKENGSIYSSISTSSNLPGEMYDGVGDVAYGGLTDEVKGFKPEQNQSIELGTKWNLANDNISVNAAIFQTDKDNKIEKISRTVPASQTGKLRVKGIEVGVSGNVTPKLSLAGGAAVMQTRVTASADPALIGKDLANVAEKSASIQAKYQATPKLALGGTLVHTGTIKGGVFAASTEREIAPSNRLDLMADYKITKKLGAQLNVKNATDATIYEALYRSTNPFVFVAPGRSTNMTLTYDF